MVQSLQTAATCTTIAEADMSRDRGRPQGGRAAATCPTMARATIEALREFPALNATLEDDQHTVHDDAVHLGHRRLARRGRPDRPGHPRRAGPLASRAWPSASRTSRVARAPNQLTPDEVRGGTFTITNPGGYGSIMATPVINQPQVGDPRHRGRRQAAGGGHRRARQRLDRDPLDDLPVHVLGPPRARRRARRAVPNTLRKKLESWPMTSWAGV